MLNCTLSFQRNSSLLGFHCISTSLGFHWGSTTRSLLATRLPLMFYSASKDNAVLWQNLPDMSWHISLCWFLLCISSLSWDWCMIYLCVSVPYICLCLVWWSVITWPIRWSDLCTWCTALISLLRCLIHLSSDFLNIYFCLSLVELKTWCLWPCWAILTNMTSLQATKTCGLAQPSTVVSSEVCPYSILRSVSIFLTVVTTIPGVVIQIMVIFIA